MKVIGGSFGTNGNADADDEYIYITASRTAKISRSEVERINTEMRKDSKFGVIGFILGAVILGTIFAMIVPVVGIIIGVALAFIGSRYSVKKYYAEITFKDGSLSLIHI